jgi:hypothetical protein
MLAEDLADLLGKALVTGRQRKSRRFFGFKRSVS